ncbi:unnamed protein product [Prorocentrum cordatum]|uniref:Uncharacterized protein n=1 Tax=Prorocentrum cordatum TaxID=2364126 RepID=A0ABN9UAW8_9DINO|nr:unnamed protein product [Polarella glacialis]
MRMECADNWECAWDLPRAQDDSTTHAAYARDSGARKIERGEMQTMHGTVGPVNEQEHDLSLNAFMGDITMIHAVVSSGPIPPVTGVSEAILERRTGPGESEDLPVISDRQGVQEMGGTALLDSPGDAQATVAQTVARNLQASAGASEDAWSRRGVRKHFLLIPSQVITNQSSLALLSAAEIRDMSPMTSDFFLVPVSNLALRKSPAAGQSYGGQVREKGKGRKLGPPGKRAEIALMEGLDRAMGALNDFLKLKGGDSERSQAMVAEATGKCEVSESYKARNRKNNNPNLDEEFWGEDSDMIQIGINGPPNFRAAPPNSAREEALAKQGQFAGHDARMAMGMLIVYVGGKKSQSAAPRSVLQIVKRRRIHYAEDLYDLAKDCPRCDGPPEGGLGGPGAAAESTAAVEALCSALTSGTANFLVAPRSVPGAGPVRLLAGDFSGGRRDVKHDILVYVGDEATGRLDMLLARLLDGDPTGRARVFVRLAKSWARHRGLAGPLPGGSFVWALLAALPRAVAATIAYLHRCPAAPECPSCSLTCPARPSFTCPPPAAVSCPACPTLVCPAVAVEAPRAAPEGRAEAPRSWPACAACEQPAEPERAAQSLGDVRYGDDVPGHVATAAAVRGRDLHILADGSALFVEEVPAAELEDFMGRAVAADARVVPVMRTGARREVTWAVMAVRVREVDFGRDWRVTGPRTTFWCIKFINNEGMGIDGHHDRLRAVAKLKPTQWCVQEHFQGTQYIRPLSLSDQCDGTNLQACEAILCRMQTIEYSCLEKCDRGAPSHGQFERLFLVVMSPHVWLLAILFLCQYRQSHLYVLTVVDFCREDAASGFSSVTPAISTFGVDTSEALRRLRAHGFYGSDEDVKLGNYNPDLLSLPSAGSHAVPLADLRGAGGRRRVAEFVRDSVLPAGPALERRKMRGVRAPYSDPALRQPRVWSDFVSRLHHSGLLDFACDRGRESVEFFCVPKKDQRLRLVCDCRHSNVWFREPDNVTLCTGETLGNLEVGEDETLYISEADLSNAFYHLQLPVELRDLFTLRRVRARDIGLTEIDGMPVRDGYVDNFVAISTVASKVHRLASAVVEGFREAGLVVTADVDSPGEDLARDRTVLGWDISCRAAVLRLVGHMGFISLVRRESLSVFDALFAFIRRFYSEEAPLWPSVINELTIWEGIAPLLWRNLKAAAAAAVSDDPEVQRLSGVHDNGSGGLWDVDGGPPPAGSAAAVLGSGLGDSRSTVFREVPLKLLRRDLKIVGGHKWNVEGPMPILEGRAILYALRHALRNVQNFGRRIAALGDALVAACAVSKGRSDSRAMLKVTQSVAALCLATGRVLHCRWLPSEWSVADGPSRGLAVPSVPQPLSLSKPRELEWLRSAGQPAPAQRPRPAAGGDAAASVAVDRLPADWVGFAALGEEQPDADASRFDPIFIGGVSFAGRSQQRAGGCARVKEAARRRAAATAAEGLTVCQTHSVRPATLRLCQDDFASFKRWLNRQGRLMPEGELDADQTLSQYLDEMYLDGAHVSLGQRMLAAVLFHQSALSKAGGARMARGRRALKGWQRLAPAGSRLGVPYEVMRMIVMWMWAHGLWEEGLVTWLTFEMYYRPNEPFTLRARDLAPPVAGSRAGGSWSLTLHAREHGVASKTQEFDQAQLLDLDRQASLGPALGAMLEARFGPQWRQAVLKRPAGAAAAPPLFAISTTQAGQAFDRAVQALGLRRVGVVCRYQLRHGGASHDAATALREPLRVPVFVEIFSGSGRLGRAAAHEGLQVLWWDISFGDAYDLTLRKNQNLLLGEVLALQRLGALASFGELCGDVVTTGPPAAGVSAAALALPEDPLSMLSLFARLTLDLQAFGQPSADLWAGGLAAAPRGPPPAAGPSLQSGLCRAELLRLRSTVESRAGTLPRARLSLQTPPPRAPSAGAESGSSGEKPLPAAGAPRGRRGPEDAGWWHAGGAAGGAQGPLPSAMSIDAAPFVPQACRMPGAASLGMAPLAAPWPGLGPAGAAERPLGPAAAAQPGDRSARRAVRWTVSSGWVAARLVGDTVVETAQLSLEASEGRSVEEWEKRLNRREHLHEWGWAMAPGGAATLAVSAAVGAPAAWAGLRWATSWLAALVAASTSCPSCVCHAPQWPPPTPPAPPPPPAPSAGAVAAAVAQKLGPLLAANSSPAPASCPSADEVAAALLERLPPLRPEEARAAPSAPEDGPAVGEGCPFAFILAWGVACGEAVVSMCCCVAARRVLLYPAGGTYWWVLTPDGDRCAEDVSGSVGDGCNRAFTVALDGTAPALAHGASYRLAQPLTWEELRAAVLRSRTDQQVHVGDEPLVDPAEVVLESGGVRLDDDHAMVREAGVWQLAEAIPVGAADTFRDRPPRELLGLVERDLPADARAGGPPLPPPALPPGGEADPARGAAEAAGPSAGDQDLRDRLGVPPLGGAREADSVDDVRTLRVQHDEQGDRHRPRGVVAREIKKYTFEDWPFEDGLSTVEHMAKRWEQNGGSPLLRLDLRARGRQLSQTGRSYIEMKCLLTSIFHAGSYDQPPKWGGLRHYVGVAGPMDAIDPALRTAVFRRNKEEMEPESLNSRAAGLPLPSPLAPEAGEGLPSGLSDHERDWPQLQGRGAARLARRACQDFEVVDALNWLMKRTGDRSNIDQMKVHARILECVAECMPPMETAIPSPRAAFSELLHGRSVYDESAGRNVGRLRNAGQISLPETAVGGVECGGQPDLGFTLGTSDISDEIGVTGRAIGGSAAPPDRRLVPACAALPMGSTWSLYFCREVGEAVMGATPGLERAHRMSDQGPTTALRPSAQLAEGGGAQHTCVDNLGVMGFDGAEVSSSFAAATTRFDAAGLRTHGTDIQRGRGVTLGCVLDGVSLTTRLTAKRYWRVRQGVSWALSCRALPGWTWEIVLGHCTYCATCNRDLLPVFNAMYKFIAAHYQEAAPLWPTARAEMVAFRGLMPLLRGDWTLPRCPLVCLSDASEHGCAVSASLFEPAAVKEIGRVQERSRFRRLGGHSARARFFASNGIVMTSAGTFKDAADLGEHDEVAPQTQWGLDRTFKEMAAEIFSGPRWTDLVARGWLNTSEDILVYESRALLRAVEILCSLSPREGERAVVMSDNLPAVLCFERRRAKNFLVLACIRRAVALCLSLNKRLHVIWVPGELNPSDEGFRLYDPGYDPGKTLVHSWEASEDYGKVPVNRRLPQHVHEQDNARTKTTHYCKHVDTENCKHDKFGKHESTSKHTVMGLTSTSATTSTSPRTAPQALDEPTETPGTLDPQDLHEPQRSQPAAVATSAPECAPAGELRRPAAAVGDQGRDDQRAHGVWPADKSGALSPPGNAAAGRPEGLPSGPQAPASQARALGAPRDGVRQRLTLAPPASGAAAPDLEANCSPTGDGEGSDATTVANEAEAARTRQLRQTARHHARAVAQAKAPPTLAGFTLLERSAVRLGTEARYQVELKAFIDAAKERQLVVDSEVDDVLVHYMNGLYESGHHSNKGDVLLSALLHFQPQHGKLGRSRFLRAWRCLKGWRRRCGRRSRNPVVRMVWSAVVWGLCCRGCWLMGVHILWMIVTHRRPGEPLAIQRQDLIQPAEGSSNVWGMLLFPQSRAATLKMLDLQNRHGYHMELKKRSGRQCKSSLKRYQNAARLSLSAPRLLPWQVAAPRKADQ